MTWRTSSATFGDWDEVELNCWREDQTTDVVEDPIIWALRCPAVRTLNFRRELPRARFELWGISRPFAAQGVRSALRLWHHEKCQAITTPQLRQQW